MSSSTKAGANNPGEPLLQVRGVTKRFPGVRALKGVDLRVFPGAVGGQSGLEITQQNIMKFATDVVTRSHAPNGH